MGSLESPSIPERYAAERAKRFGAATYGMRANIRDDPSLSDLQQDPWADYDELAKAEPYLEDGSRPKFLIVGAGHCGLMQAWQLINAGFDAKDIVLVDTAGGWGGTWYWNRYPGLECDVEGYCYLPLLEQSGFVPKWRYSPGSEIRENAEFIAAKFGLQGMFCTAMVSADWDQGGGRWLIRLRRVFRGAHEHLNKEFTVSAQFLISAIGPMTSLSVPSLPGLSDFRRERKLFHGARWDYDYTGGSQADPSRTKLQNKVVGVIGTGSTAAQVVAELGKWWRPTRLAGKAHGELIADDPLIDDPSFPNFVDDARSRFMPLVGLWGTRRFKDLKPEDAQAHTESMLQREAPHVQLLRDHINRTVKNPAIAAQLTPWYPGWCKRPAYHASYLQTFDKPNVTLVDTNGQGVQAYTARGVVAGTGDDVREYALDALVLATGFDLSGKKNSIAKDSGYKCTGRDGRSLDDKWESLEFATLYGLATHGFPNYFFLGGTSNTAASANTTSAFMSASRTIAHMIKGGMARSADPARTVIKVSREAELEWTESCMKQPTFFAPLATTCLPTYFTGYKGSNEGADEKAIAARKLIYPRGPLHYDDVTREWAEKGTLDGVIYNSLPAPKWNTYETKIAKFFNGGWFLLNDDERVITENMRSISNNTQPKVASEVMSTVKLYLVADKRDNVRSREGRGTSTGFQ
ncbi:FAD/NAD(P)-binding domain-containing protein [Colletotrichum sublineola]|nr:FAD/NAD(P)-binding domain-containing protein [Colletotrichum sublineola]